jgi:Alpha-(1,6)-fucosyltransferase N- and catalytic domains
VGGDSKAQIETNETSLRPNMTNINSIPSFLKFTLLAVVSFGTGRSWRFLFNTEWNGPLENNALGTDSLITGTADLQDQFQAQAELQRVIEGLLRSNHCNVNRAMGVNVEHAKDGFASEFQYVSRLLQMAVSTNRLLVLEPQFHSAYEPPDCTNTGWECHWEPISICKVNISHVQKHPAPDSSPLSHDNELSPLSFGVRTDKFSSAFFDIGWYGPNPLAWAPISFPRKDDRISLRADVLPFWERSYGRFWVRAQMAHYLWKPNSALQAQIDARFPATIRRNGAKPFIGFHVRFSDNIKDLQKGFARDASATRTLARFMEIAEDIRRQNPNTHLAYIYLATDNTEVVKQAQQPHWEKKGWKFIMQSDVQRSNSQERMWFREGRRKAAGAIATDIEVLRRADFLVGSFQSNVYRLACQLNTAWQVKKYSLYMNRHFAVDVEWYEDP